MSATEQSRNGWRLPSEPVTEAAGGVLRALRSLNGEVGSLGALSTRDLADEIGGRRATVVTALRWLALEGDVERVPEDEVAAWTVDHRFLYWRIPEARR